MKMMTSPGDGKNKSGASHLHRRNSLAEYMRYIFEGEQLRTSITPCTKSISTDKPQRGDVTNKQQQQQTRRRSSDEICDEDNHGKITLCSHHEGCDCGRIDASLFSDIPSQELDKWPDNLGTTTGDGYRDFNRFSGKEKKEESFSPSLVVGHRHRYKHGFSRKELKSETKFSSSQDISTDICGEVNAQAIRHDSLDDSFEPLPIKFNKINITALSSRLFQQQQVKRRKIEISSQKQAVGIRQDRTQQKGELSISTHGTGAQEYNQQENQSPAIPLLGAVEFTRDDLEAHCFQAAHFKVNPADMQVRTRCQTRLHCANHQEKQHKNFNLCLSNCMGGTAMTEGRPTFEGQKDIDISMHCSPMTGGTIIKLLNNMKLSRESQQALHDWDKSMGLRKSHSKTMRASSRSRKKLQEMLESLRLELVLIQHQARMA